MGMIGEIHFGVARFGGGGIFLAEDAPLPDLPDPGPGAPWPTLRMDQERSRTTAPRLQIGARMKFNPPRIIRGDTGQRFSSELTDGGVAYVPSESDTVLFKMRNIATGTWIVREATLDDGTANRYGVWPQPSEVSVPGVFHIQWAVIGGDSRRLTFPRNSYQVLEIIDAVAPDPE